MAENAVDIETCLGTTTAEDILLALAMGHKHEPSPCSMLPIELLSKIGAVVRAQQMEYLHAAGRITPPATPRLARFARGV